MVVSAFVLSFAAKQTPAAAVAAPPGGGHSGNAAARLGHFKWNSAREEELQIPLVVLFCCPRCHSQSKGVCDLSSRPHHPLFFFGKPNCELSASHTRWRHFTLTCPDTKWTGEH